MTQHRVQISHNSSVIATLHYYRSDTPRMSILSTSPFHAAVTPASQQRGSKLTSINLHWI